MKSSKEVELDPHKEEDIQTITLLKEWIIIDTLEVEVDLKIIIKKINTILKMIEDIWKEILDFKINTITATIIDIWNVMTFQTNTNENKIEKELEKEKGKEIETEREKD